MWIKMTRFTDTIVHRCSRLHHGPAAGMCVLLFLLQAGLLDYFLVFYLSLDYIYWLVADFIALVVLVVSMVYSYNMLERQRSHSDLSQKKHTVFSISWLPWTIINVGVVVKIVLLVETNALENEDGATPSIFGANTFKTAVALGSCIFIFLLTTQHDAPLGSRRRTYIYDLTGHVVFDILDTADILEVCFNKEDRQALWSGLEEIILTLAALNLLLPTVPLVTLSRTQFGRDSLSRPMMYLHRLLVVLVVNVPNLLTRLLLWQTNSVSISPFTLKNIILIGMTLYEFYEHKKEKMGMPRNESAAMDGSMTDMQYTAAIVDNSLDLASMEASGMSREKSTVRYEHVVSVDASDVSAADNVCVSEEVKGNFFENLTIDVADVLDIDSHDGEASTSI